MKFIAKLRVWGNWGIGENVLKVFLRLRGSANRRVDLFLPLIASISGWRQCDASKCEMRRLGRVTPSAGRDVIDRKACYLSLLAQAAVWLPELRVSRTFLDILRLICSVHGYPARRAASTADPNDPPKVTRQRPGTERPSVEEDGRVRRPCPNQRNKSERKENMRQPQLCSMPASPWRSVPSAAGKPRCLPRRNHLSRSVDSGYRLGTSFAWGFLLQNGAVDADNLPASPLSQQGSPHEHRTRGNVRRWGLVSAERGLSFETSETHDLAGTTAVCGSHNHEGKPSHA